MFCGDGEYHIFTKYDMYLYHKNNDKLQVFSRLCNQPHDKILLVVSDKLKEHIKKIFVTEQEISIKII